ncbi:putative N-acetyltransferase p20 [Escovopsis weberi]|uniref:Putative N-acetyltransferase p20 n=1 Tax=Escovopsis weberi TaxID=150374 RepID=A0A0M8N4Z9_ESCWE|nr:putative N-acetyltransferase p20 [Escovopsis weberi]
MAEAEPPMEWVTIRTTTPKPYPPMSERAPILTQRLVLRPLAPSDLPAFHALRLQPEVMKWTMQGAPDPDMAHSSAVLAKRLPGSEGEAEYEFAVCWAATGEMIGTAGSHMRRGEFGWPVIGYMLRSEFWGRGLATELVEGFLAHYWALPRQEVELEVERSTVGSAEGGGGGGGEVKVKVWPECLNAVTAFDNGPSQKVLAKTGFVLARTWMEEDPRLPETMVECHGYIVKRPETC